MENKIIFKPASAEADKLLLNNPDRGFRLEAHTRLATPENEDVAFQIGDRNRLFEAACNAVRPGVWAKPKLIQVFVYMTEFKTTEILPEYALNNLQRIFDALKENNFRGLIRFAYQGGMMQKEEQASDDIMFCHMKQVAPILEKNKSLIHTIEAGFLGAWGEWHSFPGHTWETNGFFGGPIHYGDRILSNIMNTFPDDIYIQIRYPGIKNLIDRDLPVQRRMGLNNDAFFGYHSATGWPYTSMDCDASLQAATDSLFAPMGGEFFWGMEWPEPRVTFEEAVLLYKYFHQNSFSVYHNSFEGTPYVAGASVDTDWYKTEREGDMSIWLKTPVDRNWLDENKIFYSADWFKDKNGNNIERSGFEFVRDHLGYRIEAKSLEIDGEIAQGEFIDLSLELVNYGFSAAFNMQSKLVILDENNKMVSFVRAGNPEGWNNGNRLITQKINSVMKLPSTSGKYKIAFYLHNSADEGAYLANDIEHINGYNILFEFQI